MNSGTDEETDVALFLHGVMKGIKVLLLTVVVSLLPYFPKLLPRSSEGGGAVLLLALPGHDGSSFGATGLGLGRQGGGNLDGRTAEASVELVHLLHEGAGLGVDEFGGFLEQAQLGLAGGFEAVEDNAGFDVGVAGLPDAGKNGVSIADQVEGAAGGNG